MKTKTVVSIVLAMGFVGLVTPALGADALMQSIDEILAEPMRLVGEWEDDRLIALGLTLGIAVCGACVAVAQALPSHPKLASVMLGAMITLLTAIANLYLDFDHRQYRSLASQGRQALSEAKARKAELAFIDPGDKAGRELVFNDIRKAANRIIEMPDRLKERTALTSAEEQPDGFFVRNAHANGAAAPDWIARPPRDETNLYFVGSAQSREYADARKLSSDNAYLEAQNALAQQFEQAGASRETIARFLIESARVVSTYSTIDPNTKTYRAYTLISLSKRVAASDLKAYGVKTGTPTAYLDNRVQVYFKESNKAQRALTDAQYKTFEDARNLRRAGRPAESAATLEPLLRAAPDFYLGWYTLALAYDDAKNFAAAKAAYERAVALERQQNLGDASLYNSYGYLLYRNRQYADAVTNLEKALAIAPDHPKAKTTLAATKAAMGR